MRVADPAENAVIGNYSLSTALFLTMSGTAGDTTDAFARLLGVENIAADQLHPAVNAVDLDLESRSGEGVALSTGNNLFVQNGLQLKDGFLNTVVASYGAPVRTVDFKQNEETAAVINEWVANETENFIEEIADPNSFPLETVVVFANAMYLKAAWALEFERLETLAEFILADGSTVETEYMYTQSPRLMPMYRGGDFVAVELPYFSTMVDPDVLLQFSGRDKLEINRVLHVARIEVDEKGTTAAAATGIGVSPTSMPETVDINSPFLYFIRDRVTNTILFIGHVTNPAAESTN